MYSQSFTPINLYSCTTQMERRNSGLKKEEFIKAIKDELGESLIDGTYQFQIKKSNELYLNGRKKGEFNHLCQNLILRKLFNNIKRIYSIQQADRNSIIKEIKILLEENVDMHIVRLDVRHFYESIIRDNVLNRIVIDSRLSHHSIMLLTVLFNNPVIKASEGLPRGLGISAVMAEMYMKYFDLEIKRIPGVYYYARFVDDIIVFCSSDESQEVVWKSAEKGLSELGLELNKEKSYRWRPSPNTQELTYLGYAFQKNNNHLDISIAAKKLKTIKTKITKAFVSYSKCHDFSLLKQRIKFLTGNYTLYRSDSLAPIKVGIYFNYKMATNIKPLIELDRYYQRLLHCQTGRLGSKVSLPKANMKSLEKYSFRFGYENHVNHYFTLAQIEKITECWR